MKHIVLLTMVIAGGLWGAVAHNNASGDTVTSQRTTVNTLKEEIITLSPSMRDQGVTHLFDDGRLQLTLTAKTLSTTPSLKFARIMNSQEALSFMAPMPGYTLGSAVYMYDFGKEGKGDIAKDISLSLSYGGTDPNAYLAFYDRNKKQWRTLPSVHKDGRVIARTRLPFSQVGIIEKRAWMTEKGVDLWAIPAKAVYVEDAKGNVLLAKNSSQKLPIASITKLMTALVFLDYNPGWNTVLTYKKEDDAIPAKFYFKTGEQITVKDAFYGAMVGSKNNAAKMLSRATGLSSEAFVQKMNEKAQALGMHDTVFVEPTGLDERNISTAKDIVILTREAYKHIPIVEAAATKRYVFTTLKFKETVATKNSNALLGKVKEVMAGKTGYTQEAGFSMVGQSRPTNDTAVTVALLGCPDDATRFDVVGKLIQLAVKNGKFTFRIAGL